MNRCLATRAGRMGIAAVLAGVATGLAACGVPVGGEPSTIKSVPYGLLRPTEPSSTPVISVSPNTVVVYFVGATSHLVPVARDIYIPPAGLASDAGLETLLSALIDGPNAFQAALGMQGAIPSSTRSLAGTHISGSIATVNLSKSFSQLAGQAQIEAIAQVVFTVIGAIPGLTGVTFEIEGQAAQVPLPDGALVKVATRGQYDRSLGPL